MNIIINLRPATINGWHFTSETEEGLMIRRENMIECGACPGLYYDHQRCVCTDDEKFIRDDTGEECCRYHPNATWDEGVSSDENAGSTAFA